MVIWKSYIGQHCNIVDLSFSNGTSIPHGCQFKFWLLQFQSRSLLMPGKQWNMAQFLGTLHPCVRSERSSWLQNQLCSSQCGQLESEPAFGRSLSLSFSLSHLPFVTQPFKQKLNLISEIVKTGYAMSNREKVDMNIRVEICDYRVYLVIVSLKLDS